jgi:hypothetical protein
MLVICWQMLVFTPPNAATTALDDWTIIRRYEEVTVMLVAWTYASRACFVKVKTEASELSWRLCKLGRGQSLHWAAMLTPSQSSGMESG